MLNILKNLDWSVLIGMLMSVIPALLCITIHELAHGFTAYRLGDNTAKSMGRLTLNPIKHIDILGILMMVVFGFGWAKPVPVNMRRFRKPKRHMAITALAGPLSNIIFAAIVFFIYGLVFSLLGGFYAYGNKALVLSMIYRTAVLSVALAIFNLLPIPPLDGSKVLFSFLPEKAYYALMRFERYGMILLIFFVRSDYFSLTVGRATYLVRNWMSPISQFSFSLVN